MTKLKIGALLLLAASMGVVAVGGLVAQPQAGKEPAKKNLQTNPVFRSTNDKIEPKSEPTVHSNLLPSGAITRLGTTRFRHEGVASALAYSPDGKWIAGYVTDSVTVWDAATGRERFTLPKLRPSYGPIIGGHGLAISPDGNILATPAIASATDSAQEQINVIGLWDMARGKPLRTLSVSKEEAGSQIIYADSLQFSRDGKYLAMAQVAHKAIVFDLSSGKPLPFEEMDTELLCYNVAISADCKTLAVAAKKNRNWGSHSVRLWDIPTGKFLGVVREFSIPDMKASTGAIAFSPNGTMLAIGTENEITLSDPATGRETARLEAKMGAVSALAFTSDNKNLISSSIGDWKIRMWEIATGKILFAERAGPNRGPVEGPIMALSPDGNTVALGIGATIRLWDWATGKELGSEVQSHDFRVQCLAFSPNGQMFVSGDSAERQIAWDVATWRQWSTLPEGAVSLSFSPDGTRLASTNYRSKVHVWNPRDNTKPSTIGDPNSNTVTSALFSPDGEKLFLLDWTFVGPLNKRRVVHWDTTIGKQENTWDVPHITNLMVLAPNGRTVVITSDQGQVRMLDAPSGKEWVLPRKEKEFVSTVAISPDGRTLATGSRGNDAVVRLSEMRTANEIYIRGGHQSNVSALAWSPSGRLLASGDSKESIRLWDTADGHELAIFNELKSNVSALTFAPNETMLVAGFSDGTMLVFDVAKYDPRRKLTPKLSEAALEAIWSDLAADAGRAHLAGWLLSDAVSESTRFLQTRLKPVHNADAAIMRKLIADLDGGAFAVREAAAKQLKSLGEQAEPEMRTALNGDAPLETKRRLGQILDDSLGAETLRSLRAIAVLERIGNTEATRLLEALAKGAPGVRTTEEAAAALARIETKSR